MQSKRPNRPSRHQWWAAPAAFVATLLALPVSAAIEIPDEPLTTASRVAPNILFILDDSGSMAWRYMYREGVTSITGTGVNSSSTGDNRTRDSSYSSESINNNAIYDQNYATNSLYYNPATDFGLTVSPPTHGWWRRNSLKSP